MINRIAACAVSVGTAAHGQQCGPEWSMQFGPGDFADVARVLIEFDEDANGPAPARLFTAGGFTAVGGKARGVARWDGQQWSALGDGIAGSAWAGTVFDGDGAGPAAPALVIGGSITAAGGAPASGVARWDGQQWSALGAGVNGSVHGLYSYDNDGPGPNQPVLLVGGIFSTAGGASAANLASWDGATWSPMGGGANSTVRGFAQVDLDGPGPAPTSLYIAGGFTTAGSNQIRYIARWSGTAWESVGGGVDNEVRTLAAFDEDGAGPNPARLFVGGTFATVGSATPAPYLARWDGAAWTAVPGAPAVVWCLRPTLFGGVDSLLVGTGPPTPTPSQVFTWNGSTLTQVGAAFSPYLRDLRVHDDGSGPKLYASGDFVASGSTPLRRVARLDNGAWTQVGSVDPGQGFNGWGWALAVLDPDGPGGASARVAAGGEFVQAGPLAVGRVAAWNGQSWDALGAGMNGPVVALHEYDQDGSGGLAPDLYAGGSFTEADGQTALRIARWRAGAWQPLPEDASGTVSAFMTFDPDAAGPTPPELIVGGWFATVGTLTVNGIARWNGAQWAGMGTGVALWNGPRVEALSSYDADGAGPATPVLIAGGSFQEMNGATALCVAQWDGKNWSPLGGGMTSGGVYALAQFDEDHGGPGFPSLFAGGYFTQVAGSPIRFVARWNGTAWSALGSGFSGGGNVSSLVVHDADAWGPTPPALYAGGAFNHAGPPVLSRIASWDGQAWSALGTGLDNNVHHLLAIPATPSAPPALFATGSFLNAGTIPTVRIAHWRCGQATCYPDCNTDGALTVADFGCFQTKFVLGDLYADCTEDGQLTVADFGCFQTKFVVGCP